MGTPDHTAPDADAARAVQVFYDGGCPVCRREIGAYRRAFGESAVEWRDVSGTTELPPDLDRGAALARFHVRRADGRIVSGARAFLAVWRNSRRLRGPARLLDRPPFVWVAEAGYRVFLKVRRVWR